MIKASFGCKVTLWLEVKGPLKDVSAMVEVSVNCTRSKGIGKRFSPVVKVFTSLLNSGYDKLATILFSSPTTVDAADVSEVAPRAEVTWPACSEDHAAPPPLDVVRNAVSPFVSIVRASLRATSLTAKGTVGRKVDDMVVLLAKSV